MMKLLMMMIAIGVAYLFHLIYRFLTSPEALSIVLLVLGALIVLTALVCGAVFCLGYIILRTFEWAERRGQARYEERRQKSDASRHEVVTPKVEIEVPEEPKLPLPLPLPEASNPAEVSIQPPGTTLGALLDQAKIANTVQTRRTGRHHPQR